ncbi:hypothetical protein [Streptomyces sp. MST-110588]|uniref:hypothetical protein n=1 Tax=Streptomyces sp. MST-110588 TaxID=2833628 RepID=UPI001F5C119A|nr:hypothetical protein [Streptomyces sp. MST-110588]UNO39846.1 hypothetical protein KGS77_09915 [Streptomyces sp. MST-110588]
MERVRRTPAVLLLLLLSVAFASLLCRAGGTGELGTGVRAAHDVRAAQNGVRAAHDVHGAYGGPMAYGGPVARADAPKRCSGRAAPSQSESVPVPTPHRGESLTPAATGLAPLAADGPPGHAPARPPTGSGSAADPTRHLTVLRI